MIPLALSTFGVQFTAWTIYIAVLLYFSAYFIQLCSFKDPLRKAHLYRWTWGLGALAFLIHVLSAFHFYHNWSHESAYQSTAKSTEEILGTAFGEGVYFSYTFLGLWILDALWLFLEPKLSFKRPKFLTCILHIYITFIFFSGLIFFEGLRARIIGGIGFTLLFLGFVMLRKRTSNTPPAL